MENASNQHKIPGNVNLVYILVFSTHIVCNRINIQIILTCLIHFL